MVNKKYVYEEYVYVIDVYRNQMENYVYKIENM